MATTPRKAGRTLRAVTAADDPPAPKRKPKTITEAAESSERELLVALRNTAAADLDSGTIPAHARPTMIKQLRELDKELRALDALNAPEPENVPKGAGDDHRFDAEAL